MRSAALALTLLAAASIARAQEPADAQGRADAIIRAGVELRMEGRDGEALELFRQAYAIVPSPRALGQMGLAAKSLKSYVEAERYLLAALAAESDPWVIENRDALELARDVVAKQLASLVVRSNVDGAELLVDDQPIGKLPLSTPVRVVAGDVRIEARAPGHAPAERRQALVAGQTTEVRLDLRPLAAASVAPPRDAATSAPKPSTSSSSRRPWIYAAAGVGVAGVAVGTSLGLLTLSQKEERDRICSDPKTCPTKEGADLDADARTSARWSTVGFVVGAAGLVTAGVLVVLELTARPPTAQRRAAGGPASVAWTF